MLREGASGVGAWFYSRRFSMFGWPQWNAGAGGWGGQVDVKTRGGAIPVTFTYPDFQNVYQGQPTMPGAWYDPEEDAGWFVDLVVDVLDASFGQLSWSYTEDDPPVFTATPSAGLIWAFAQTHVVDNMFYGSTGAKRPPLANPAGTSAGDIRFDCGAGSLPLIKPGISNLAADWKSPQVPGIVNVVPLYPYDSGDVVCAGFTYSTVTGKWTIADPVDPYAEYVGRYFPGLMFSIKHDVDTGLPVSWTPVPECREIDFALELGEDGGNVIANQAGLFHWPEFLRGFFVYNPNVYTLNKVRIAWREIPAWEFLANGHYDADTSLINGTNNWIPDQTNPIYGWGFAAPRWDEGSATITTNTPTGAWKILGEKYGMNSIGWNSLDVLLEPSPGMAVLLVAIYTEDDPYDAWPEPGDPTCGLITCAIMGGAAQVPFCVPVIGGGAMVGGNL